LFATVLLIASCSSTTIYPGTVVIDTDNQVPVQPQSLLLAYTAGVDYYNVTFTYLPCFGMFDWYVGNGFIPNKTHYSAYIPFIASGTSAQTFGVGLMPNQTTLYHAFYGLQTYTNYSYTAVFDIIVVQTLAAEQAIVPLAPNDGNLVGALNAGGKSGKMTWTKTSNSQDTYTVYYFDGSPPAGSYPWSACSVRRYMQQNNATSPFATVKDNGDTQTATFPNLVPKTRTGVTVVVDRTNGYSNVYETLYLNSATKPIVAWAALLSLLAFLF